MQHTSNSNDTNLQINWINQSIKSKNFIEFNFKSNQQFIETETTSLAWIIYTKNQTNRMLIDVKRKLLTLALTILRWMVRTITKTTNPPRLISWRTRSVYQTGLRIIWTTDNNNNNEKWKHFQWQFNGRDRPESRTILCILELNPSSSLSSSKTINDIYKWWDPWLSPSNSTRSKAITWVNKNQIIQIISLSTAIEHENTVCVSNSVRIIQHHVQLYYH